MRKEGDNNNLNIEDENRGHIRSLQNERLANSRDEEIESVLAAENDFIAEERNRLAYYKRLKKHSSIIGKIIDGLQKFFELHESESDK